MKKFNKKLKSMLFAFLTFYVILLSIIVILYYLTSKCLSVPIYTQKPYNSLCWATSSSMIISYFESDEIDRKEDIAKYVYGNKKIDKGGKLGDARYGIEKYTGKKGNIRCSPLTYKAVQYQINHNAPIGVALKDNEGGGHMVIIVGYNNVFGTVMYNDPADGKKKHAWYSKFLKNTETEITWAESLFYK